PALSRLAAIGPPMLPRPMKAMVGSDVVVIVVPLVLLFEWHGCWNSGSGQRRALRIVAPEIGQRMPVWPVAFDEGIGERSIRFGKRGGIPARLLVLVDQQCTNAFSEIAVSGAAHRGIELKPEHLGQR